MANPVTVNTDKLMRFRWPTLIMQVIISAALTAPYILNIYMGPLNEQYGWSLSSLMMTFTLSMWIGTPGIIIGGILMKKFGNKKCIIGSGFIYGIAIIASGYVSNVWAFVILQGVMAALMMFIAYVCQLKNVGILFPDKRGTALGILMGGTWAGTALMQPFAAWLIELMGTSSSLLVQGILYGVITVLFGILIVDAPEGTFVPRGWTPPKEDEMPEKDALEHGKVGIDVTWNQMFKMPALYLGWIMFCLMALACTMMSSNNSLIAQDSVGVTAMQASWIAFAYSLIQGLSSIVLGFVVDRVGPYKSLMVFAGIAGILLLANGVTGFASTIFYIIVVAWVGGLYGLINFVMPMLAMDSFGEKNFGVNMAIFSLYNIFTNLVGPQLSVMWEPKTCFIVFGISTLLSIVPVWLFKNSLHKAAEKYHAERKLATATETSAPAEAKDEAVEE